MMQVYRHTQVGYLLLASLAIGIVAGVGATLAGPPSPGVAVLLVVFGLCVLLFPTLTTEVDRESVRCYFGIGLIRREIDLAEIDSASIVRNRWYYGWGLRAIPGGWLWNVSGLDAVELVLHGEGRFQIGTDDPEGFMRAITTRLSAA